MTIKANIHPVLQHFTDDRDSVEVKGTTVGECLSDLIRQYPGIERGLFNKHGKLLNYVDIYVNEEDAYPEELAKPVKDGDELHIIFLVGGG